MADAPQWMFFLYAALALVVVGGMLALPAVLGQRHRERATGEPFESGIAPTGTARLRYAVKYFRMALFFVVFDVEAIFLVVWALVARELGWTAYLGVVVFVVMLLAALVYLARTGALDWGTSARRRAHEREERG